MYHQAAPSNSYFPPLQTLGTIFNPIRGWLDKLAGLLPDIHSQSRWVYVAILFTDIAGFSAALAHLPRRRQQQVLESLSGEYYNLLRQCVRDSGGSVDKFIGDGMMAIFHTPQDALRAAWQIQEHAARFNAQQERWGYPPFPTRVAVASGWVIRKNLGSFWRRNQTYLGNAVNTASHLAKVGRPGQVLISHATFERVSARVDFRHWEPIEGVGKPERNVAYELGAVLLHRGGDAGRQLLP
jgi:adenylate cyclase